MPKKTRKQKMRTSSRKEIHAELRPQKTLTIPVQEEKPKKLEQIPVIEKKIIPESDEKRKYFLQDMIKSAIILASLFIIEIGIYFAAQNGAIPFIPVK